MFSPAVITGDDKEERDGQQHGIGIAEFIVHRRCQKESGHNGAVRQKEDQTAALTGDKGSGGQQDTEPEHGAQGKEKAIQRQHIRQFKQNLVQFDGDGAMKQGPGGKAIRVFGNPFIKADAIGDIRKPVTFGGVNIAAQIGKRMGESETQPQPEIVGLVCFQVGLVALSDEIFHMVRAERFIGRCNPGSIHDAVPHFLIGFADAFSIGINSGRQLDGNGKRLHKIRRSHLSGIHDRSLYGQYAEQDEQIQRKMFLPFFSKAKQQKGQCEQKGVKAVGAEQAHADTGQQIQQIRAEGKRENSGLSVGCMCAAGQKAQQYGGIEQDHTGKQNILPHRYHIEGIVWQQRIESERGQTDTPVYLHPDHGIHQEGKDAGHHKHLKDRKQTKPRDGIAGQRHADMPEKAYQLRMGPGMMIAHGQRADNLPILIQAVHSHDTRIICGQIRQPGQKAEQKRNQGQLLIQTGGYPVGILHGVCVCPEEKRHHKYIKKEIQAAAADKEDPQAKECAV